MVEYDWRDKAEHFGKGHPWMRAMDRITVWLRQRVGADDVQVRSSMGCGGWAKVPWIVVSSPRESTQHGLCAPQRAAPHHQPALAHTTNRTARHVPSCRPKRVCTPAVTLPHTCST